MLVSSGRILWKTPVAGTVASLLPCLYCFGEFSTLKRRKWREFKSAWLPGTRGTVINVNANVIQGV